MSIRLLALLISISIIGLSACKKNNDAPTVTPMVGLDVINASADTFNFYLNGTRLNSTSTILPGTSTIYYPVPQGQQTYQVKKPFNTTTNTIQTLFSITIPADIYLAHSIFVTDETAANTFTTVDILRSVAQTDTCYIRFVNASQGSGGLDLAYGGTTLFKNVTFKSASDFVLVNAVNGKSVNGFIPITVFSNGSVTPLMTDSVNLTAGRSYTFYSQGKAGTAAFSIGTKINL
ncbi:MAG: hypothetical protein JWR54_482 [Mucilaginibacter sp.]|nr:hypothetical protein [Mucilaginibacter sp.]